MQVTLNIRYARDIEILLPLLQRLHIEYKFKPVRRKKISATQLANLQKIVAAGGNASYFGDASEWQREQRAERALPFPLNSGPS